MSEFTITAVQLAPHLSIYLRLQHPDAKDTFQQVEATITQQTILINPNNESCTHYTSHY